MSVKVVYMCPFHQKKTCHTSSKISNIQIQSHPCLVGLACTSELEVILKLAAASITKFHHAEALTSFKYILVKFPGH